MRADPQGAILARYGTVLRCYDNGGRSCDRYTIIPPRWAREYRETCNTATEVVPVEIVDGAT